MWLRASFKTVAQAAGAAAGSITASQPLASGASGLGGAAAALARRSAATAAGSAPPDVLIVGAGVRWKAFQWCSDVVRGAGAE